MEDIRRLAEADPPIVIITRNVHAPRLNEVPGLFRLKSRGGYAIYCSPCQTTDNLKFQTDNRQPGQAGRQFQISNRQPTTGQ
jgi:hypothetical protein